MDGTETTTAGARLAGAAARERETQAALRAAIAQDGAAAQALAAARLAYHEAIAALGRYGSPGGDGADKQRILETLAAARQGRDEAMERFGRAVSALAQAKEAHRRAALSLAALRHQPRRREEEDG